MWCAESSIGIFQLKWLDKISVTGKKERQDLGERMMTLVWNLQYWQDFMLSCAVACWNHEAGDTVTHMEVITEIMQVSEIAKEQSHQRWQRGLEDLRKTYLEKL